MRVIICTVLIINSGKVALPTEFCKMIDLGQGVAGAICAG